MKRLTNKLLSEEASARLISADADNAEPAENANAERCRYWPLIPCTKWPEKFTWFTK